VIAERYRGLVRAARRSYTEDKHRSEASTDVPSFLVYRPLSFWLTPLFVACGAPATAVTVLGLRMRARSREGARVQWHSVLQGECAEGVGGEFTFRWRGSPMRLVVEIDPAREEGALAIELASRHALALPAGPHPLFGATFVLG
jgi:hypothetical protein